MRITIDPVELERVFQSLRSQPDNPDAQAGLARVLGPLIAATAEEYSVSARGADALAQNLRRRVLEQQAVLVERWFAIKIESPTRHFSRLLRAEAHALVAKPRPHRARMINADDLKIDVLAKPQRLKLLGTIYAEMCRFIRLRFTRDRYRELAERLLHPLIFEGCLRPSFSNNETRKLGASRLVVCEMYSIVVIELRAVIGEHINELAGSTK